MSFNNTSFNNRTVGPPPAAGTSHVQARTNLFVQANARLRINAPVNVQILVPAPGGGNPPPATFPRWGQQYEKINIFDPVVAQYLSQVFCFAVQSLSL